MSRYHKAMTSIPLRDAGLVEFASDDQSARSVLQDAIAGFVQSGADNPPLALHYDNEQQLLQLMSKLQRQLSTQASPSIQCRISYQKDRSDEQSVDGENIEESTDEDGWFPISRLFGEVGGRSVSDYILYHLFTTYLQPVVQPSGNIAGYELLLRPLPEQMPFRPAELFETAKRIGQHSFLDRAARYLAIRLSASHLQPGIKRFINFLPSSLHCPNTCLRGTFEMMKETNTDPGDYVFEVMETEPLDDPRLSQVFDVYRQEGMRLALDDVGKGFASLDIVDRLQPDYVKMDRRWVSQCDNDSEKQRYIHDLLERAARFHGVVLAEGVERQEEWDFLKQAGVPLFQGYLFGRAKPVPSAAAVGAL